MKKTVIYLLISLAVAGVIYYSIKKFGIKKPNTDASRAVENGGKISIDSDKLIDAMKSNAVKVVNTATSAYSNFTGKGKTNSIDGSRKAGKTSIGDLKNSLKRGTIEKRPSGSLAPEGSKKQPQTVELEKC